MYMETKRYQKTLSKEKEKLGYICLGSCLLQGQEVHAQEDMLTLSSPLSSLLPIAGYSLIFQFPQCLAQIAPQICLRTLSVLVPKSISQRQIILNRIESAEQTWKCELSPYGVYEVPQTWAGKGSRLGPDLGISDPHSTMSKSGIPRSQES